MEAGTWTVRAVEGFLGEPSKQGNVPVVVQLEFLDGPVKGQRMAWFGYFTEKTSERTAESLRILGFEGDDLSDLRFREDARALAVVEPDVGQDGVSRLRVKWINRIGINVERLDQARAKAFGASLRGVFAKLDSGQKSKTSASPARSRGDDEPPHPADDIPF